MSKWTQKRVRAAMALMAKHEIRSIDEARRLCREANVLFGFHTVFMVCPRVGFNRTGGAYESVDIIVSYPRIYDKERK